MARIKCKNCGKIYRYETEGCCPECGAYNRPPRHDRINADGTIYHMKNNDYIDEPHKQAKTHGGKVCFEEKECHEEKVCYEEKSHSEKTSFTVAPLINQLKQSNAKKNNNPIPTFVVAVCVLIAVAVIGNIMRSCSGSRYEDVSYMEPYVDVISVTDDVVTVWLGDGEDVINGWLYVDYSPIVADSCEFNDDECIMTFHLEEEYENIDFLDVSYGDGEFVSFDDIAEMIEE